MCCGFREYRVNGTYMSMPWKLRWLLPLPLKVPISSVWVRLLSQNVFWKSRKTSRRFWSRGFLHKSLKHLRLQNSRAHCFGQQVAVPFSAVSTFQYVRETAWRFHAEAFAPKHQRTPRHLLIFTLFMSSKYAKWIWSYKPKLCTCPSRRFRKGKHSDKRAELVQSYRQPSFQKFRLRTCSLIPQTSEGFH